MKTDKICISILAVLLAVGIVTGNMDFWKILSGFAGFVVGVAVLYLAVYIVTRAIYKAKQRINK